MVVRIDCNSLLLVVYFVYKYKNNERGVGACAHVEVAIRGFKSTRLPRWHPPPTPNPRALSNSRTFSLLVESLHGVMDYSWGVRVGCSSSRTFPSWTGLELDSDSESSLLHGVTHVEEGDPSGAYKWAGGRPLNSSLQLPTRTQTRAEQSRAEESRAEQRRPGKRQPWKWATASSTTGRRSSTWIPRSSGTPPPPTGRRPSHRPLLLDLAAAGRESDLIRMELPFLLQHVPGYAGRRPVLLRLQLAGWLHLQLVLGAGGGTGDPGGGREGGRPRRRGGRRCECGGGRGQEHPHGAPPPPQAQREALRAAQRRAQHHQGE